MDIKHTKNKYPTQIELCEGKYTIIYDFETGRSECLRYNEPWRKLVGDKMVLACFDEIVSLRQQRDELLAALKMWVIAAQNPEVGAYVPSEVKSAIRAAINNAESES